MGVHRHRGGIRFLSAKVEPAKVEPAKVEPRPSHLPETTAASRRDRLARRHPAAEHADRPSLPRHPLVNELDALRAHGVTRCIELRSGQLRRKRVHADPTPGLVAGIVHENDRDGFPFERARVDVLVLVPKVGVHETAPQDECGSR